MNNWWISTLSGLGGAIVGGLLSLLATWLTLKKQNEQKRESDLRNFNFEIEKRNLDIKSEIYIKLAGILEKITISLECDEETGKIALNSLDYENNLKELMNFTKTYSGVISLYFPGNIRTQLIHLQSKLYQISKDNTEFTSDECSQRIKEYLNGFISDAKRLEIAMEENIHSSK